MTSTIPALDLATAWDSAMTYDRFVAGASPEHRPLWEAIHRTHRTPEWATAMRLPSGTRLLAIAADWCGDAVNTLPAVAKWAEAIGVEFRVLDRDSWPQVMDHYLTDGARSIPVVIVLDADLQELGHWGPRPRDLQAWVMANKASMEKTERSKEIRRWYAKDHGEATIREIAAISKR
ncbi:MAG: thioredoxin family protein [Gemmatimonadales bacterium]